MTLVLVRSPKGGVGTTFLAARLSIALAARGRDVHAVDCTSQDSLKLFFGLGTRQPLQPFGETDAVVVASGVRLTQGHEASRHAGFADRLATLLSDQICFVDISASDAELRDRLLPHAALEICAITPTPIALAALTKVDADTPVIELEHTAFVLNQTDDRRRLSGDIHALIRTLMGDALLGTVRRDEAVNEALAAVKPLAAHAPTSAALSDLERLADALERRLGLVHAPAASAAR